MLLYRMVACAYSYFSYCGQEGSLAQSLDEAISKAKAATSLLQQVDSHQDLQVRQNCTSFSHCLDVSHLFAVKQLSNEVKRLTEPFNVAPLSAPATPKSRGENSKKFSPVRPKAKRNSISRQSSRPLSKRKQTQDAALKALRTAFQQAASSVRATIALKHFFALLSDRQRVCNANVKKLLIEIGECEGSAMEHKECLQNQLSAFFQHCGDFGARYHRASKMATNRLANLVSCVGGAVHALSRSFLPRQDTSGRLFVFDDKFNIKDAPPISLYDVLQSLPEKNFRHADNQLHAASQSLIAAQKSFGGAMLFVGASKKRLATAQNAYEQAQVLFQARELSLADADNIWVDTIKTVRMQLNDVSSRVIDALGDILQDFIRHQKSVFDDKPDSTQTFQKGDLVKLFLFCPHAPGSGPSYFRVCNALQKFAETQYRLFSSHLVKPIIPHDKVDSHSLSNALMSVIEHFRSASTETVDTRSLHSNHSNSGDPGRKGDRIRTLRNLRAVVKFMTSMQDVASLVYFDAQNLRLFEQAPLASTAPPDKDGEGQTTALSISTIDALRRIFNDSASAQVVESSFIQRMTTSSPGDSTEGMGAYPHFRVSVQER